MNRHTKARRGWLALAALLCAAGPATAQGATPAPFPTKPIKIIVGFPAGGPLDAHARLLADRLGQLLGQPVIVDSRPAQVAPWVPTSWPRATPTATRC